jgi:hypothetical protein
MKTRGGSVEPRRARGRRAGDRRLALIGGLFLLGLVVWMGVEVARSTERERRLRAELRQVYQEAENLRSVAAQWRDRALLFERQIAALTAERNALARRLRETETELGRRQGRAAPRR